MARIAQSCQQLASKTPNTVVVIHQTQSRVAACKAAASTALPRTPAGTIQLPLEHAAYAVSTWQDRVACKAATAAAVSEATRQARQVLLPHADTAAAEAAAGGATGTRLGTNSMLQQPHPDTGSNSSSSSSSSRSTKAASRAAVKSSRQLTKQITSCNSWQELQQLHNTAACSFNIIHISAMLSTFGKQLKAAPAEPCELEGLELFMQQLERTSVQLMSVIQLPQTGTLQVWRAVKSPQLQLGQGSGSGSSCSSCNSSIQEQAVPILPQQLSTMAWGWATCGFLPGRHWWSCYWALSTPQLPSYSLHELATAIWAAAKLQQHPPLSWMAAFWPASMAALQQLPQQPATTVAAAAGGGAAGGRAASAGPAAAVTGAAAAVGGGCRAAVRPQEICMMLWGLAELGLAPPPGAAGAVGAGAVGAGSVGAGADSWWSVLQQAVSQQLPQLKPRDLAQVLWAHSRLQAQVPEPWLQQLLAAAAAHAQLAAFSGRDAAMLLWALAAGGPRPPGPQLLQGLLRSLSMSNCKLEACVPQDFAHILWALAVFKQQGHQHKGNVECTSSDASCSSSSIASSQSDSEGIGSTGSSIGASSSSSSSSSRHSSSRLVSQHVPQCMYNSICTTRSMVKTITTCTAIAGASSSSSCELDFLNEVQLRSWACLTWRYTQPAHAGLSQVDAAQLLWAASQLGPAAGPDEAWMAELWHTSRQQLLRQLQQQQDGSSSSSSSSAQALTLAMWAGFKMHSGPPASWLMVAVPLLQQQLADLQPAAVCQLLYVIAKLGHRPNPAFMEQLLSRLQLDSHQLEPRGFACVVWSLGRLGYQPGANWWDNILHHLQGCVGGLGEREVGNVVYGLAVLQPGRVPQGLKQALMQRLLQLQQQLQRAGVDRGVGGSSSSSSSSDGRRSMLWDLTEGLEAA